MAKTLRQETAAGFTTKGSQLTWEELDQTLVELDGGVLNAVTASGAATEIDLADGHFVVLTLEADTTISIANTREVDWFNLRVIQDIVGSRVITWPANTRWPHRIAESLSVTAGYIDAFYLETWNTGTNWNVYLSGANIGVPA